MLQDSDFFERLEGWMNIGEDVRVILKWEESPSPDERYAVNIEWRYQGEQLGLANYVIEPILGTDELRVVWINLNFAERFQRQGFYTTLINACIDNMPRYGVTEIQTAPLNKDAETALASRGFKWRNNVFVADLVEPHRRLANPS